MGQHYSKSRPLCNIVVCLNLISQRQGLILVNSDGSLLARRSVWADSYELASLNISYHHFRNCEQYGGLTPTAHGSILQTVEESTWWMRVWPSILLSTFPQV